MKTSLAQPLAEAVVLGAGSDLADDIDVLGGTGGRCTRLSEPKVNRRATDEDDLVQDRTEQFGGDL